MSAKEIRTIFCKFKLRNSATHATHDGTVNKRIVQIWFKFSCVENNIKNRPRGKTPVHVDGNVLRVLMHTNPSRMLPFFAKEIGMCRHMKNMGKAKKLDKQVPHKLKYQQKELRFEIGSSL